MTRAESMRPTDVSRSSRPATDRQPLERTAEQQRLTGDRASWMQWGPYVAERAWGTVREDYSSDGEAWDYFPYDHARSRAYRWNEDGMAAISDDRGRLCLGLSLWNEQDDHLKERMFGLTGPQGNHGEDVKEHWWYTDATPTHSWLEWRYAYPLSAFPYQRLIDENAARTPDDDEFELLDTGVFDPEPGAQSDDEWTGRWVEVTVQYAKAGPDDIVMRIIVENASAEPARLHVLPTLWFRNTWAWSADSDHAPVSSPGDAATTATHRSSQPAITIEDDVIVARHPDLGTMLVSSSAGPDGEKPRILFCDNETNAAKLFGSANRSAYPKDGINDHVVHGADTVNPDQRGTKAAVHHVVDLPGHGRAEFVVRMAASHDEPGGSYDATPIAPDTEGGALNVLQARRREADEFYSALVPDEATEGEQAIYRAAAAGLIWVKQYYPYDVSTWLRGDPGQPAPPSQRLNGRNHQWQHVAANDILSMPDSWEYPWFAAWDLAFHTVALAHLDPEFAKEQLLVMLREWYMHPNGQLPAYEWSFGDVNPPVHAWAAMRVFEIDGGRDLEFLEKILHKMLLNFTWWVNRKDAEGNNLFEGGFLGMDNIGPFDRSTQVPPGMVLEQSDATSWMAMFCLDLCRMSVRLAADRNPVYEDLAIKFLEHFAYIATAMRGGDMWDEDDGFYYDVLTSTDSASGERTVRRLKVQSMVGLLPLFAVRVLTSDELDRVPGFAAHLANFARERPEYARAITGDPTVDTLDSIGGSHLLALVRVERLGRILSRLFDTEQFLAPTGIRSLSKAHADNPFSIDLAPGWTASVGYEPAESRSYLFGGNSNWRGPVWFPVNHLIADSLARYGNWTSVLLDESDIDPERLAIEMPTGSGRRVDLSEASREIASRLLSTFLPGPDGVRPAMSSVWKRIPPEWRDRLVFNEYFHADTGAGLGASHQTGWTALVIDLIAQLHEGPGHRGVRER